MDLLHGSSQWHGVGGHREEWDADRPNKRLKTSNRHASILLPVSRLVRSPLDTLASLAEGLGYGSDTGKRPCGLPAVEQEKQLQLLRLRGATTSEGWNAAATALDQLEGGDEWKQQDESEEYDFELIRSRLGKLQDARRRGDIEDLRFQIRTALTRDLGGMGNVKLYKHSRVGTKALIERYIDTVVGTIDEVVDSSESDPRTVNEIMTYARQSFGRSALLLSGGGTLGMNHIGVVKALFEAGMLPRIISGASAGSIVCAVLCTKTDAEMPGVLQDFCYGELDVFEKESDGFSLARIAKRFLTEGAIYNIQNLTRVMKNLIGDMTFQEAYYRTQRILTICVSSAEVYEMPKLLNYITAPNVVIWSAVAASCSVPLVFRPADLQVKDEMTGELKPWNDEASKWIDGSVDNDLPMTRLAEMLNVNHFIVSQVNPHVVPFLAKEEDDITPDLPKSTSAVTPGPSWMHTMANLAKGEALHRMHVLAELGVFPNAMTKLRSVLGQRYSGDITIIPEISYTQFPNILMNPSADFMVQAMLNGERATWPKLSRIRNHLAVELKLDEAVARMRTRIAFSPSQVDLRIDAFSRAAAEARSRRGRTRRGSKGSHQSASSTIVPRQKPGRQAAHRLIKSMLDPPSVASIVSALDEAASSASDHFSSADDTVSPRSSSPTPHTDEDDDDSGSVVSDTSESPPPHTGRWSSIRQPYQSASQPVTPSIASKTFAVDSPVSPRTPAPRGPSLTMTPSSEERPSSAEQRYKKLFHAVVPMPTIRSQAGTPEPRGLPKPQPAPAKRLSRLGLRLDMPGTKGMMQRRKRRSSTGLRLGHGKDCPFKGAGWGEYYCRCFIDAYLADKTAPPECDVQALSTTVFDIPELREHILGFLPMRDLTRMQRVDKAWHHSVRTSPQLQRHLFLAPMGAAAMPLDDIREPWAVYYNLSFVFNPRLAFDLACGSQRTVHSATAGTVDADFLFLGLASANRELRIGHLLSGLESALEDVASRGDLLAQYVTQPPCAAVEFTCRPERGKISAWVMNRTGVTLGDTVAGLRAMRASTVDFVKELNLEQFLGCTLLMFGVISNADDGEDEESTSGSDEGGEGKDSTVRAQDGIPAEDQVVARDEVDALNMEAALGWMKDDQGNMGVRDE
ncbi:hypothetical protein LTR36_001334 [Oleoguttula mirabilis]|uniref:PNPLA domain-containing protein n=1 Tax=Oleoguttula mirabilis TaxID=1507867 RepID=A0AAV9JNI7_9PEZI|nr:hypothetical protein LTR36_001334 [Oleoguttula mirabilis]